MQNRILVGVCLLVLLAQALTPALAQESVAPKLAAVIDLERRLEGKPTATVDAPAAASP